MEASRGEWRSAGPTEGNGEAAAANGVEWRPRGPIQGKMGLSGGIQGFLSFFSGLGFSAFFFFTLPAVLILLLCAAVGIKAPVAYRRGSGTCPHLSLCLTGAPNPALSLGKNPWPLTRPQHWNCLMAHGDVVALWWQRDQGGKPSAVGIC